jgi:hypothetical protein
MYVGEVFGSGSQKENLHIVHDYCAAYARFRMHALISRSLAGTDLSCRNTASTTTT